MAIQGDIVKEYLKEYPTTPTLTLAKIIVDDEPDLFDSVDSARTRIRYYRGKQGKASLKALGDKRFLGREGDLSPFGCIPEGEKELGNYKPYEIQGDHALILADMQIPFHDDKAIITTLKHGKDKKINSVILLGDICDHYAISRFDRDPRRKLKDEVHKTEFILEIIRDVFPDAEFIWLKGNHEERYEITLRRKTPELFGIDQFSYEKLYHTDDYNIKVIEDRRILRFGKYLKLLHGHEFTGGYGTVNPARTAFLKAKDNVVVAHNHRSSSHKEKTIVDKIISTWSIGCLCNLHPRFMPINNWNLGFGRARRDEDNFRFNNYGILNNEIYRT